jgi:hypothetical protein
MSVRRPGDWAANSCRTVFVASGEAVGRPSKTCGTVVAWTRFSIAARYIALAFSQLAAQEKHCALLRKGGPHSMSFDVKRGHPVD